MKSDTVTVAADGSTVVNVYYDRTEKTLTFKYKYSNRNYQSTETITAKWGSDISEQYKKIATNAGSTFWSAETSGDGPYTNYFGVMPQTSATYYNRGAEGSEGTMTYWGQDLNGEYTVKLFEVLSPRNRKRFRLRRRYFLLHPQQLYADLQRRLQRRQGREREVCGASEHLLQL